MCYPYITISISIYFNFFYIAPDTTEIYTLSLHDALPILTGSLTVASGAVCEWTAGALNPGASLTVADSGALNIKIGESTCLNSSHIKISYVVLCLRK